MQDLNNGWTQVLIEHDQLQPYITTRTQAEVALLPAQRLTCLQQSQSILAKLPKYTYAVNAMLAYSRGQLAIAPCTDCYNNYESYESAAPFPDCVFLPGVWGFSCASCIMRGRAADCTFHVHRAGYHEKCWESVYIEIDSIDNPESKWLERGHPLTAFNPSKLYPIWKRCRYPGDNVPHDLAKPLQKPSSIRPSNSVTASLSDTGSRRSASHLDCEALNLLQQKLQIKKNIVLITGAGISTNAGIPDFQSSSRSMQSSRKVYDSSAYSLQETATRLNGDVLSKLRRGQKASLTSFDLFAEKLAEKSVYVRANEDDLSGFVRPKVLLYGEECPDESAIMAAFDNDLREQVDAVLIVGTRLLIPSVMDFAKRLSKTVRAQGSDNMVVWVNKEPPKLGSLFDSLINYEYLGDCDAFASLTFG
ncbi:hypothetical protein V2G26_018226 [Clonostachys chloroleuca]